MAKVIEDVVVVKFSKLVKDDADNHDIATKEILQTLEQVSQELAGDGIIVEVERP
jgi:hypothetical protein